MVDVDSSVKLNFANILAPQNEGLIPIRESDGSNILIFVHGFRSNSLQTWGLQDHRFWPFDFANELGFRAFCYQYANPSFAGVREAALPFDDIADRLLDDLCEVVDRNCRVFFISHSFGGLLTKNAIVNGRRHDPREQQIIERVFGTSMIACPNYGHWIAGVNVGAQMGGMLSAPNAKLLRKNNPELKKLNSEFIEEKHKLPNLAVQNIAETGRFKFIFKIPKEDQFATGGENEVSSGNHATICSDLTPDQHEYQRLKDFILRRSQTQDRLQVA